MGQSVYYVVTGLWPLGEPPHLRGGDRPENGRLVGAHTVGVLVAIGLALLTGWPAP